MTKNTINLPTKNVIVAFKENVPVYNAIDHQSGGYPYWTDFASRAHDFTEISCAIRTLVGLQRSKHRYGNVNTTISLKDITDDEIIDEQRKAALSKLTEDERRVLGF